MRQWGPIVILLAAAGAVVWFLRGRGSGADASQVGSIGQVGSTSTEEITPDLVTAAFDFARDQINQSQCWRRIFDGATHATWEFGDTGRTSQFERGFVPFPACGYPDEKSRWLTPK